MSLERLDEAYKRYINHLSSVKQRSLEDARAKLVAEYESQVEAINRMFDNAVNKFKEKLKKG